MTPLLFLLLLPGLPPDSNQPGPCIHRNITATVFWVGETGNVSSSWDESWTTHFGGTDDPKNRSGWHPAGFTPLENPFYIALPFNEVGGHCDRYLADSTFSSPPFEGEPGTGGKALCKNRWVKITRNGVDCYAQWEDVGPFLTCDPAYVFGQQPPANTGNHNAGIDVSPAVRDYLGMQGNATVDWCFVPENQVPEGPWKEIITTSPARWK